jgi:hypothetical protein
VSSPDGPERGRETEGPRSGPVSSPSQREAGRREQAKRDTTIPFVKNNFDILEEKHYV